jgi:hypothetical protein
MTTLAASPSVQAVEQGIRHFLEGSTTFMNALDAVERLHPFIGGWFNHQTGLAVC